ncbi:MAG: exodeoxyribonuclease subunit alpha [Cyanobacteria bacterium RYN_339]|nr:exodeoxyribonuclease subunit alpha [Cyanobacteria bacterium RYN_339]
MSATLHGVVERITYHSPENGYTVAKLAVPGQEELITAVGHFGQLKPGEAVALTGSWGSHPKHGDQFKVDEYRLERPASLVGLEKYLGSGLIKGVGPKSARRLVAHFGLEILDVIENHPERLHEVAGVGRHRIEMIATAWKEQKRIQDVMIFLQTHGVSTTYAVKIYKTYGDAAIEVVSKDPYRLATDIWGIGFKTADEIAQNLGMAPDAPSRLRAGLLHVLGEATDQGHMFLPREALVATAGELLGAPVEAALDELVVSKAVVAEPPAIYLPAMLAAEQGAAARLLKLLARPAEVPDDIEARLDALEDVTLSPEQRQAVLAAMRHRVFILTGGPGTGKTTTVKTIVRLLAAYDFKVLLASPTGRAAKRLAEVTGQEARTLHRLLEFKPDLMAFTRDGDRPLEADVILVDEASMLDTLLAHALLKAVPPLGHLVLVGDTNQLPSVGPGNVLGDLLNSGVVPQVELTQVFRQAESSLIVTNAHRIRRGELPELVVPTGDRRTDCYFLEADSPEAAIQLIVNVVGKSLPKRFGLSPIEEIQVLCPMNRGVVGAGNLNKVLQAALNPGADTGKFRLGDKVIQLRNNYDKQVFNGDMGIVVKIDAEEQLLVVKTLETEIEYDFSELDELGLAYAISVHKSQGSEFPAVVLPIMNQHYPMLQRNLLYTGLTRARQVVVLVGTKQAIRTALRNAEVGKRFTGLKQRLAP